MSSDKFDAAVFSLYRLLLSACPIATEELGQSIATTQGQSYTVDFWAAHLDGAALTVSAGTTVFSYLLGGDSGYNEFTFTFVAQGASSLILFNVAARNMFFLDDVSVTPTSVPDGGSTLPLLGFASLGLAALRRKLSR